MDTVNKWLMGFVACLALTAWLLAEHPSDTTKSMKGLSLSKEQVTKVIRTHVEDTQKNNGSFSVQDDKTGEKVTLTLEKIHTDRIARMSANQYFVCADFKAINGNMYDLDFIMESKEGAAPMVTETIIHKKNGAPRYRWKEENGVWKREMTEGSEKAKKSESSKPNS